MLVPSATFSQPINLKIKKPYFASVAITNHKGEIFGSGVIIEKDCKLRVLFAAHVIEHMKKKNKKIYLMTSIHLGLISAKVLKIDHDIDLALLGGLKKIKDSPNTFVKLAKRLPFIGDTIWMISSPRGKYNTVTKGILSNIMIHRRQNKKKNI